MVATFGKSGAMEKGREASQKPVTLLGDRERRSQSWLKPAVVAGIILLLVWADVPYAVVGALVSDGIDGGAGQCASTTPTTSPGHSG